MESVSHRRKGVCEGKKQRAKGKGTVKEREKEGQKIKNASAWDRTMDLTVNSRSLCRLSHGSFLTNGGRMWSQHRKAQSQSKGKSRVGS